MKPASEWLRQSKGPVVLDIIECIQADALIWAMRVINADQSGRAVETLSDAAMRLMAPRQTALEVPS